MQDSNYKAWLGSSMKITPTNTLLKPSNPDLFSICIQANPVAPILLNYWQCTCTGSRARAKVSSKKHEGYCRLAKNRHASCNQCVCQVMAILENF